MLTGWLINDRLTCILGTKTFWHDLLNWFPDLQDKTNGHTSFNVLAKHIEEEAIKKGLPDFVIRNASFFRKLNFKTKTISYLQDAYESLNDKNLPRQLNVCNTSNIVVCNSPFVKSLYKDKIKSKIEIIPIGTDFKFFKPLNNKEELRKKWNILPYSILFVGSNAPIKGFKKILSLINETKYNFCLVMKDNTKILHDRVKTFNNLNQQEMLEVFNCCTLLICTSIQETQHLAGIEAAACGLPIVTTKVGIYYDMESGPWGKIVEDSLFVQEIENVFSNLNFFKPREFFLQKGLDKETCKNRWITLVKEI